MHTKLLLECMRYLLGYLHPTMVQYGWGKVKGWSKKDVRKALLCKISGKLQGRSREGLGKVWERYHTKKNDGSSKEGLGKLQGSFKEGSGKLQGSFREASGKLQGRFREASSKLPWKSREAGKGRGSFRQLLVFWIQYLENMFCFTAGPAEAAGKWVRNLHSYF